MADVTGVLGDQPISLNNAATEATLRALLTAIQGTNASTQNSIRSLVRGSNLDPELIAIQNQNTGLLNRTSQSLFGTFNQLGTAVGYTSAVLTQATQGLRQLANNAGAPSDIFGTMANILPGIFGKAAQLGQEILKVSESWLKTYRTISDTGVNFNGSLSQMRLAASSAFMPLEKFAQTVTTNSKLLAAMGPTANEGARAFAVATNSLVKSDVGSKLLGLGFRTEELGDHMLNYIAMTGGRSQQEMQNTKLLTRSTGEYLGHLDALAQLTGKSRKQQEEEMQKVALNAAFQRKMQTLDAAEQGKMMAALAAANATGIEGAADAVMTEFLGFPPVLESARNLAGFLPETFANIQTMVRGAQDAGTTLEDVKRQGMGVFSSAIDGAKKFGQTGDYLILMGNRAVTGAQTLANQAAKKGLDSQAAYASAYQQALNNQIQQEKSEAAGAAEAEKRVREAMNAAMEALVPLISAASQMLQNFVIKLADGLKYIAQTPTILMGLWTATKVLAAAFLLYRGMMLGAAIGGGIGDILERRRTPPAGGGTGGGRPGGGPRPTPAPTPQPVPRGGGRIGAIAGAAMGGGAVLGGLLYSGLASAEDAKKIEEREKELDRKATLTPEEQAEKEELRQAREISTFGLSPEDKARLDAADKVLSSMPAHDPEKAERDRQDEEKRHADLMAQMKKQTENMEKAVNALRDLNPNLFK